ncbi:hypothetical protein NDU88_003733 [Pleurodeles waltl]|uniref:Uncharacterized protein n=1 Tax=Pleurodeles waltl TaxID=8319 RepID=A0AAV7MS00_PLEWA|nr:hypothetical protein NDU88_003733 [Pleurodeles waltl]
MIHLFGHVAPAIKGQEIILDCTHRVGRPSKASGQAHYQKQKEQKLAAVHDLNAINFDGHKIYLYQDLSPLTLQCQRVLRPITSMLQEKGICYKWDHPFRLQFVWQNEMRIVRTQKEADSVPDMSMEQGRPSSGDLDQAPQAEAEGTRLNNTKEEPINYPIRRAERREHNCCAACENKDSVSDREAHK